MGRIDLALRAQPDGIPALCVLKRMHAELRSPEHDARFRREANIALQLSHAAIARTVGVEEIDGELVLLQELVHGVDVRLLGTRLATAGERVPLAIAVHVASEVARALAHAHAFGDLGIVHRDVTPDNIMLSFAGEVKLIDFGIARSDVDATVTSAGQIVGRPTYTAPEIWRGAQADRRADIYSLGVVVWQLLTGRRFAEARTDDENAAPAPSTHNPDVSPELDAVVARALARKPDERHQDAAQLHEALRAFLPPGFLPERALAALLARHFDVTRERRMLAAEVSRATRALPGARAVDQPVAERPRRRGRPTAIARKWPARARQPVIAAVIVIAGLAVAAGLGVRSARQGAGPIAAPVRSLELALPSPVEPDPAAPQEPTAEAATKTSARRHPRRDERGARPPGRGEDDTPSAGHPGRGVAQTCAGQVRRR